MRKPKTYTENEVVRIILSLKEELADLEHEQWANWTDYYFSKQITQEDLNRWMRQINTPYHALSQKEKDSDREYADKVIKLINSKFMTVGGFNKAIESSKLKGVRFT